MSAESGSGSVAGPGPADAGAGVITVVLCDDVADLRELARAALDGHDGIRVVGEAADGPAAARLIAQLRPRVAVLDLFMPGLDGLEVLMRVRATSPQTRVVVFSGLEEGRAREVVLRLSADRYLRKGVPLARLREAVLEVGTIP